MKKFLALVLALLAALPTSALAAAQPASPAVTREQMLTAYFEYLLPGTLAPEKRPQLEFKDVTTDRLRAALEKAVYFGLLDNRAVSVAPDRAATVAQMALLARNHWGIALPSADVPLSRGTFADELGAVARLRAAQAIRGMSARMAEAQTIVINLNRAPDSMLARSENFATLDAVYRNLRANHYDAAKFTDADLVFGAAKGMAEATKDKWAAFFPPADAEAFQSQLSGTYEGVGAYVDMAQAGDLRIVSPIPGSPADKAGLKPADRVVKIGGKDVTETVSLQDCIDLIKGPAGTSVEIVVDRAGQSLTFSVIRSKITVAFVEDKKLDDRTYFVKVSTFGYDSAAPFKKAMDRMAATPGIDRLVIDLRNDPGGSLSEVADMLSTMVPEGQPTIVVKYRESRETIVSDGSSTNYLAGKKVVLLANGGSASASEIMAGTLRDYLGSNMKILGEKTYGKGSVQTQLSFSDGSGMKFTVAKWFTGKTETGIDGKGILPDVELKFDDDAFKKDGTDNQLEAAKKLQF